MDKQKVLKAIADETRMNILKLLLRHNYCVRVLANELNLTEATISQHLNIAGGGLACWRKARIFHALYCSSSGFA